MKRLLIAIATMALLSNSAFAFNKIDSFIFHTSSVGLFALGASMMYDGWQDTTYLRTWSVDSDNFVNGHRVVIYTGTYETKKRDPAESYVGFVFCVASIILYHLVTVNSEADFTGAKANESGLRLAAGKTTSINYDFKF